MSSEAEIKRLIQQHKDRLQILEEQKAAFGDLHVPAHIVLDIKKTKKKIEELQKELKDLDELEPPSSSSSINPPAGIVNTSPEPDSSGHLRVFLCHSSEDKEAVRNLYYRLRNDGVNPWLDAENLLPGQEWRIEIPKAVRSSDVVIVCLSRNSTIPGGYVQKEIGYALNIADKQPKGTIFIIPVRLEDCKVPERFRRWHWVDLFEEDGYERLMGSLRTKARQRGISMTSDHDVNPADVRGGQSPYIIDEILKLGRDPLWQAIAAIIAIIALGVTIYATFFTTEGKTANTTLPTQTVSAVAPTATSSPTNLPPPTATASPAPSPTRSPIPLPVVKRFSVNPAVIVEGESVTMEWEVEGTNTVSIDPIGEFPRQGSRSLKPTESIIYTLTASNAAGSIAPIVRQVMVTPAPIPPTITPTLTPTLTPTPTNTPTTTPTVTLTPTLELPEGKFAHLKILQVDNRTFGPTDFEWQWLGLKSPDTGFEVRVWRDGEPPSGVHNAELDNQPGGAVKNIGENTYRLNADITEAAGVKRPGGDYWWTVVLVHIAPEYADDLGVQAEPAQFHFAPSGSGGGGDGDGGSPTGVGID